MLKKLMQRNGLKCSYMVIALGQLSRKSPNFLTFKEPIGIDSKESFPPAYVAETVFLNS